MNSHPIIIHTAINYMPEKISGYESISALSGEEHPKLTSAKKAVEAPIRGEKILGIFAKSEGRIKRDAILRHREVVPIEAIPDEILKCFEESRTFFDIGLGPRPFGGTTIELEACIKIPYSKDVIEYRMLVRAKRDVSKTFNYGEVIVESIENSIRYRTRWLRQQDDKTIYT